MINKLILAFISVGLSFSLFACQQKQDKNHTLKIENISKEENKTNDNFTETQNDIFDISIYKSYEDYKLALKNDKNLNNNLSKIYSHKNNQLTKNLKIAVLFLQSSKNDMEYINKNLQLTNSLFLSDVLNDNIAIIPIFTESSSLAIKQAITQAAKNDAQVVISTLPSALSKTASMEFENDNKNILFISLPYIPIVNHENTSNILSFGINPIDQINTIVQFAKYNSIKNISFVLPSNRFGGDLSLMFNKSIQEFNEVSIENAEFFTNTTKLTSINIEGSQDLKTINDPETSLPNSSKNFDAQREDGSDIQNIDDTISGVIAKSKIKTNIHFYVNKILYYHYKKLEAINEFVKNFNQTASVAQNLDENKKSSKDESKWKTIDDAIADKALAIFFTGSVAEKEQFMEIINAYKKKSMYKEVFENVILITDSTLSELIENSPQKFTNDFSYYKDIFVPYQSFNEMQNYNVYFEKKLNERPTKLSYLLYDALSFINLAYSENDDFSNITSRLNTNFKKAMQGVLGEFTIKNSYIKRSYRFIYIDKNGDIFKI